MNKNLTFGESIIVIFLGPFVAIANLFTLMIVFTFPVIVCSLPFAFVAFVIWMVFK